MYELHFPDFHHSLERELMFPHFIDKETEALRENGILESWNALVTELGCLKWWAKGQALQPIGFEFQLNHFPSE
jgi:hypothetical protein